MLLRFVRWFPNGSIWQTRYLCFPFALVVATVAVTQAPIPVLDRAVWFALGLGSWTLLEYLIHRWVFHYQPRGELPRAVLDRFHVLHHRDPANEALVCVPLPVGVVFWSLLLGCLLLFGGGHFASLLFTTGVALMMVIYDLAHFSAHYMPATNWLLRLLKRNHMLHHFADHGRHFGVTSPVWDYVFRTQGARGTR